MICGSCKHYDANIHGPYCKKAYSTQEPGYSPSYHPSCSYDPKLLQLFEPKDSNDLPYIFKMYEDLRKKHYALEYENRQLKDRLTKI